ncbi:MAG TPA: hypothetical protein ENK56_08960 [Chloroflexi bacterium]|nr:hypothetical protein [Chloroflexota bacterium]
MAALVGGVLALNYRLQRHWVAGFRMDRLGVAFWLLVALVAHLAHRWGDGLGAGWSVLALALALTGLASNLVARWMGYLWFRPRPQALDGPPQPVPPDSRHPARASGTFITDHRKRYEVEVPAFYTTVPNRLHIVMARLEPRRFLLLGSPDPEAWGWWYIFIEPKALQAVRPGRLYHGLRPRPALEVRFQDKEGRPQVAYLSFDDEEGWRRVWADLVYDGGGA